MESLMVFHLLLVLFRFSYDGKVDDQFSTISRPCPYNLPAAQQVQYSSLALIEVDPSLPHRQRLAKHHNRTVRGRIDRTGSLIVPDPVSGNFEPKCQTHPGSWGERIRTNNERLVRC